MSLRDPEHTNESTRRAILLSSYGTGAVRGKNLGVPGYSYDLVAQLFVPLLARYGEVIPVARDREALDAEVSAARERGLSPVHVSFVACQDMVFASSAPNVVVPAWEFPDVPNEAFDGNTQNNWVATANLCDLVLVGGEFTVDSFVRAGITTPIRIVPVPTPDEYFHLSRWSPRHVTHIDCPAYVFPHPDVPVNQLWDAAETTNQKHNWFASLRRVWRENYEAYLPPVLTQGIQFLSERLGTDRWRSYVRNCRRQGLELSGVVYTSIFSPRDGRKNWQDLLTGFVSSLHDCPDATLLVKLITREKLMVEQVLEFYRAVGLSHRCKVIIITDYLPHEQMLALVQASTYYLTTTRAEGNCLPLMNYLAAGRPGISPNHTAISDYFSDDIGLTLPWHPEPAIWPQDNRGRIKTTWARLEWPALVERLRASYFLALHNRVAYEARAAQAQQCMRQRASVESVWKQLAAALDYLATVGRPKVRAA